MVDLVGQPSSAAAVKATTTAGFSADVIAESSRQPVLVHFLSARNEACRQLQILLERAVKVAAGKIKLVTMDIDAQPQIAARLGIRAVPAVYAFQRGQPVDGFAGPLSEAQVKNFVGRLVGPLDDGTDDAIAEADAALAAGDTDTAASIYASVIEQNSEHVQAAAGLARALVAMGQLDGARDLLAELPPSTKSDPAVAAAQAAIEVADQANAVGELTDLLRRVDAEPDNHQARFDLALGLNGKGRREEAADALLTIMQRDRAWNDGGARKQLLQLFEAWGLMDPVTLAARRKLSTLLFS